ncbi:MAG TPA: hypothetical protein VKI19_00785 [Acidimicrobiales bacterium]|nr:hypothetical protein [Acidimicrobiales bacterium]
MRQLDYRAFGEAFILRAVTPERVVDAVARIAGDRVELGPIKAGPGGRATVNAHGRIGEPQADEEAAEPLTYTVRVPVDVSLQVKVGTVNRYAASGTIDMRLVVRTAEPLKIVIDVEPVRPEQVRFEIEAKGMPARFLGRAGDVDGELRRHTAAYVNERIGHPDTSRFTTIDLLPLMERVWADL